MKHCFAIGTLKQLLFLAALRLQSKKQGQDGPKCRKPVTSHTHGISQDAQDLAVSQNLVALEIPSVVPIWGDGGDITHFLGPTGP